VLYSFTGAAFGDGATPYGALIFNSLYAGRKFTLYGTTYNGGKTTGGCSSGCGTVFQVCAPSNFGGCGGVNAWQEKVLHVFTGKHDGSHPFAGVITDKNSNLYGTTVLGGGLGTCMDCGTAFRLRGGSPWTFPFAVIHRFKGGPTDGANPYAGLCCNTIFAIPILYGTTVNGGSVSQGVVFKVNNVVGFPEAVLYSFGGTPDGDNPYGALIFNSTKTKLYGTTGFGGTHTHGTVFQLSGVGFTTYTVLYNFCPVSGCGYCGYPLAGLTVDSVGNLYGTTSGGGGAGCGGGGCGTVFELSGVTETVLHSFTGASSDGSIPWAGLIFDPPVSPSNLYGTRATGGTSNVGIVYSHP
jgi:uncharacterized repeat protein (TIGR03803 family)